MGLTAIALIYSPWGKRSGAHMNPAVTLTFLRLGHIARWDAAFYILAQFIGGTLGVLVVLALIGDTFAEPPIRYITTLPGRYGVAVALLAEFVISFLMMSMILRVSNSSRYMRYTGLFAGLLVATWISIEGPLSGMSMNPARTFASALPANVWTSFWIYLLAPIAAMQAAAAVYVWRRGRDAVKCSKLIHSSEQRCIHCGFRPQPANGLVARGSTGSGLGAWARRESRCDAHITLSDAAASRRRRASRHSCSDPSPVPRAPSPLAL